jgi:hypothetical protein
MRSRTAKSGTGEKGKIAMNWILALQKELGSVRGLPEDMQYVRNAMIILGEARKEQAARNVQRTCAHVWDEMLVGDEAMSKQVCQACGAIR